MSIFVNPDTTVLNTQLNQTCGIFNVRTYPDRENFVADVFKRHITPYYGDQTKELEKMWENTSNRKVRVLCVGEEPVAIASFETTLSDDDYVGETLKIKHLFVLDPKYIRKGYEKTLIDYIKDVSRRSLRKLPDLSYEACDKAPDNLEAFKKEGFTVVKEVKDFYKVGVTIYFLKLPSTQNQSTEGHSLSASPMASRKGIPIKMPGDEDILIDDAKLPPPFLKRKAEEDSYYRRRDPSEDAFTRTAESPQSSTKRKVEEDHVYRPRETKPKDVPLKQIYLSQIKSGRKTVEGRINSGMFRNLSRGSVVRFFNQNDSVTCEIEDVKQYTSFKKMLESEGLKACLPECKSLDEGVRLYDAIPGYAAKAAQHGVVALRLLLKH